MTLLDQTYRKTPALPSSDSLRQRMLIEEARRLRRRRWASITIAAAVIAAAAIVVSTTGSGPPRRALPTLRVEGSTFHQAPLSRSATTNALLDYLMPTNGTDFAKGFQFASRMDLAAVARQLTCMARAGEPGFGRVLTAPLVGNNLDYPNLSVLSRGTFQSASGGQLDQFHGPFPVKGSKTLAFALARQHCGATAYAGEQRLLETGGIVNKWEGTMQPVINQSAGFKAHDAGYRSCLRAGGLTPSSLWTDSDALEAKIGETLFAATLHYRSLTYARCIGPVEHWRVHVRSRQRVQMINSHRAELAQLEDQVYAYLRA